MLPELFKVTFVHSECWICTDVMKEMEICIKTGPGFSFIKPLILVCCTLPGHFLLYLIKMFICTRKMQSSLSLLGVFFLNVLCESQGVSGVACLLINKCLHHMC